MINKVSIYLFSLFIATLLFTSCEKDNDKAIVLPPIDTTLQSMQVNIGVNYDTVVFVSLTAGVVKSSAVKDYDLSFDASPESKHIYLNTGKYMFAWRTQCTDIINTNTTGLNWLTDSDNMLGDSTVFGSNLTSSGDVNQQIVIIDRGKFSHIGSDRYRKIQIVTIDSSTYTIRYSKLNNSDYHEFVITKDNNYSQVYFSFNNGGQMVSFAPPKDQWEMMFTRYIHTYWDEPLQFRYYSVNGVLSNRWNNITCAILKKDSLPGYMPFENFNHNDISSYPFYSTGNIIGFEWKYFNFNDNKYYITPDIYYILKDKNDQYYKIKFYDFYNTSGERGYPAFYYQRIF